jgi:glycerol-3-phosphate O-acyltransferase / dihydroxyacetone phosphate acyltransferase
MLISILKFLMRLTTLGFFKKITVRNKEIIPKDGPLMILANHPSTFMDPIVISTILKREVFYLAKGELFKSKFANWMLPKLNMIPVYRKQDDPNQMDKNTATFKKCFEHLEKGGAILMFPEGTSITERKLRPIKTGAARIVLGAEERNDFNLGVKVITIGLNYENPHRFNRTLFVNIDEPIEARKYKDDYQKDNFAGCEKLTEQIRQQLEALIISIYDNQVNDLEVAVEHLYQSKLSKDLGISKKDNAAKFVLSKNITKSVAYFIEHKPVFAQEMHKRINDYLININRLGLTDSDLNKDNKSKSFLSNTIKAFFTIILGFPFYVYGLINNYLPFEIPGFIAEKTIKQLEYRGPIAMVTGTFTFLIFYSLQIMMMWKFSHHILITLGYAISLPLSGLFAYWYYHEMKRIKANWILLLIFYKKSAIISKLMSEREAIITIFDEAKKEYNSAHD